MHAWGVAKITALWLFVLQRDAALSACRVATIGFSAGRRREVGKEEDNAVFSFQGFNGQQFSAAIGNLKVQDDCVRWMGAAPRTPLRALIARESRSFRALAQTADPDLLTLKSSPRRNRDEEAAGNGLAGIRWNSLDGLEVASSGRRSGSVKVKGGGIPSPPSGCSSPRSFGTRLGLASSHKIRAFKKVATTPPKPMAEDLRSVQQQLGALFAKEREEPRDITAPENAEPDGAILIENGPPSPRDLIDAQELARTGAPNAAVQSSLRPPWPGNENRATKPTGGTDSQELRYLFAKDWALQTSDEDDEFWDSGSLCGVSVVSPLPRSGHDQRRRRTKNLNSPKREKPGHSSSSRRSQPFTSSLGTGTGTGTWTQSNHPLSTTSSQRIGEFLERHVESTSHGDSCRLQSEGHGSKSSLGTLLAEEIATSRSASSLGGGLAFAAAEPTWSVPTCSDNSRRPKIGSLSDISAPVRPESKSQLDFLIAKILTLQANSMENNKSSSSPARSLSADDGGGCSTSGSFMQANAGVVRVADHDSFCGSPSSGENLSTRVDAPSILQMMDPPSPEIRSATTPQEEPRSSPSSSSLGELLTTSTVVETTCAAPITVTDAGQTTSRHEVDDASEASQVMARSSNGEPEVEVAVVSGPERVPLGTLLERAREEHGWSPLSLSRSRMGSPLNQAGSQAPASSNNTLRFNNFTAPTDENFHHSSECFVPSRTSSPTAGSLELDNNHPLANLMANSTTDANSASLPGDVSSLAAVARAGGGAGAPMSERPPTQRVSLLSLLNQDMEMEFEDGSLLHLEVSCSGVDKEEPAETEELDPMCCVCMVGHKGAAFIPCGHTFCRKCCREVRRSIGSCPLCNQAIVDVLKLY